MWILTKSNLRHCQFDGSYLKEAFNPIQSVVKAPNKGGTNAFHLKGALSHARTLAPHAPHSRPIPLPLTRPVLEHAYPITDVSDHGSTDLVSFALRLVKSYDH